MRANRWVFAGTVVLFALAAGGQTTPTRIKDTVHNLSVSGPGEVRATSETRICIFCHTPHNSLPDSPLWNRKLPASNYQIYSSSSLRSGVGQPTGSSKLCLSCHDGTIALGAVLSQDEPISMTTGANTMPPGSTNLGTDLSDDHPISFAYVEATGEDSNIVPISALPEEVQLDGWGELQCTSCHDPHDNSIGNFLVLPVKRGKLCTACHSYPLWSDSAHATATTSVATVRDLLPGSEDTMEDNACQNCHRTHGADSPSWILKGRSPAQTCLVCHDGTVTTLTLRPAVSSRSAHPLIDTTWDQIEAPDLLTCTSCHNPHAAGSESTISAGLPPSLAGVPGVRLDGSLIPAIERESQLCYRCHGDNAVATSFQITRQVVQDNTRLEFGLSNPSFHPVEGQGINPDVPSLMPPRDPTDMIGCSDCHDSSQSQRQGGTGPSGPHGSDYAPILARRYETADYTPESKAAYDLCYACHERGSILRDQSFEHDKHVRGEDTPCSVCHDPHGIPAGAVSDSDHTHLINFDLSVVAPDPVTGRLDFIDNGVFAGECYLFCHDAPHSPRSYGE